MILDYCLLGDFGLKKVAFASASSKFQMTLIYTFGAGQLTRRIVSSASIYQRIMEALLVISTGDLQLLGRDFHNLCGVNQMSESYINIACNYPSILYSCETESGIIRNSLSTEFLNWHIFFVSAQPAANPSRNTIDRMYNYQRSVPSQQCLWKRLEGTRRTI